MRTMSVDLGDVRIGIALTDMLGILASPYETYRAISLEEDVEYIANLAIEKKCSTIVVGYPINMDGTIGERADKSENFANLLDERLEGKYDIVLQDERLTSVTAENILIEQNVSRERRKDIVDQVAACIILEQYLKSIKGDNHV